MSVRWLATLLCLTVLGCSGSTDKAHTVKGRIVDNGAAWSASGANLQPGDPGIRVEFCPLDESGAIRDAYGAIINTQDGTFTVPGPNNKGLPEGKYRIAVHIGAFGQPDKLKGALNRDKSTLTYQVPSSGEVVIDIGKKTLVQ
jgi:hypothetical protein